MTRALVTGASSGIGRALAIRLAQRGTELVLVARDEARLRELAGQLTVPAEVLSADLGTEPGCATVEARLRDSAAPIDVLVNNAGIGLGRAFADTELELQLRLVNVNVVAVVRLTHAALPAMLARRSGAVLNVSSVAGFLPGGAGATYSASKAFVTNFTESLASRYRRDGVRFTALCPGYTRTEFHERADVDIRRRPWPLWLSADAVAAAGLRALDRGDPVCVPGALYKPAVAALRVLPRPVLRMANR